MQLDPEQIRTLAPKETTFKAGQKLANSGKWNSTSMNNRAIWGSVQGSGKNPYIVQVDMQNLAYKCSCPSRQFPCKHALALLLQYSTNPSKFDNAEEPEHVTDWINKREARSNKVEKEEKELSEDVKKSREDSKTKRKEDRLKLVAAGLVEIKAWLKDLMQLGLLELPSRNSAYYDTMIKRMVDAKAPGLSSWIRALKNVDYKNEDEWQQNAMSIIAKLFLLISAAEKLDKLDQKESKNIQSLLGWTFNQKDILSDSTTVTVKDQWLVIGAL